MELTAGLPYWLINSGLLFKYPKLDNDHQAHVAIIGGGISGALSAYFLTEAGLPCLLLDARTIGLGSTCASTSLIQYELDIPLHQLVLKKGDAIATRSYQLCYESVGKLLSLMKKTGFNDFEKSPSLYVSRHLAQKKFMHEELNARKTAGFDVQMLDEAAMKNTYGIKAVSGILSTVAASIDTYKLTHHLLQHAIKKGLKVYDRTKVIAINENKKHLEIITEDNHRVYADYIVNAAGYEVVNFIEKGIVNFDCTYAIASEQQPDNENLWQDGTLIWTTDDPYLYLRTTTDNRLLAGGRDERFSNKTTRQVLLDKKQKLLEKDVGKLMPGLSFKTEFTWSGTFGKTKDSLPYIGSYTNPKILYALGFGGNGITFSLIAAEINRDIICGRRNPDADLFNFNRS